MSIKGFGGLGNVTQYKIWVIQGQDFTNWKILVRRIWGEFKKNILDNP